MSQTKKIKIAVGVDEAGNWAATGSGSMSERQLRTTAFEMLGYEQDVDSARTLAESIIFVEVEIPVPQAPIIEGVLTDGH